MLLVVPRFLLPVAGLQLDRAWSVGPVLVRPGAQAAALTAEAVAKSGGHAGMRGRLEQVGTELAAGAIADVTAENIDAALELTESAVDVLRVFKESRRVWAGGTFGLPGQVYESTIRYIAMDARAGVGGPRRGDHLGTTLTEDDEEAWASSRGIARVAPLIDRDDLADGHVRALMGVRLLSQAMLEHRDAMRLLNVMVAADALLGRRARSFELARRWVYFGCGRLLTEGLCGRDRPTCPYLALDPALPADRKRLKQLRDRADADMRWRCSEWSDLLDRYDARSHVAHGGHPDEVVEKAGQRAAFWTLHYLLEPILEWLIDHPEDPLSDLDAVIARLPEPPDWEQLITAGGEDAPACPA